MSKLKKTIEFKTAFESYIADEIIGEGGSGRVYQAQDETGNIYAIKTLDTSKDLKRSD